MKYLKIMMVLALVCMVSAVAYAETQSVKVSGDITMQTFGRNNFDLNNDDPNLDLMPLDAAYRGAWIGDRAVPTGMNWGTESSQWSTFLQSIAEVQVEADLTDNVSGVVRLVNQRVWGSNMYQNNFIDGDAAWWNAPYADQARTGYRTGLGSFNVELELAYIELKEFLYSPLTLKIGRQDLWFGRGFIVGANYIDPNMSLFAPEYTAIKSFDAVRMTLDYDPWTIDGVFAKIAENWERSDDDTNLWGLNIGYVFEDYNAEAEAYWFMKQQRFTGDSPYAQLNNLIDLGRTPLYALSTSVPALINNMALVQQVPVPQVGVSGGHNSNDVHTVGARGSFDPIEDWTIALEGAYQFGEYLGIDYQQNQRNRSAWAVDAEIECRFWQDDFAWRPTLGAEYIFYSGEEDMGQINPTMSGSYQGWDPMFRGKADTAIREWQNVMYRTYQASTPSWTNQHQILVKGGLEPTDSLALTATWGFFWLAESWAHDSVCFNGINRPANTQNFVGQEVDLNLTWDYTEDVQFGLLTAWFFPGDHFDSGMDDVATDIMGSVKLSF